MDPQVSAILRALVPEEIDMLRDAFIFMDRDSDGYVNESELMSQVLASVGAERFPPLCEYLSPLFSVADKDKDGRLSLTEFLMSFADGPGVVPAEVINDCVEKVRVRLTDEEMTALQESFRRIDKNQSGYVEPDELVEALRTTLTDRFPDLTDKNYAEIVSVVMNSADADRDGRLSLSEFIRSYQEDQGVLPAAFLGTGRSAVCELSEDELQVLKQAFTVLDKNNDGYVDFIDLYRTLWDTLATSVEDQEQIRDLCDLILVTADRNGDGHLSLGEFVNGFMENVSVISIPTVAAQIELEKGCSRLRELQATGELEARVRVATGADEIDREQMVQLLCDLFRPSFPDYEDDTLMQLMEAIVAGAGTDPSARLTMEEFVQSFREEPEDAVSGTLDMMSRSEEMPQPTEEDLSRIRVALRSLESGADAEGCVANEVLFDTLCAAFPESRAKAEDMFRFVAMTAGEPESSAAVAEDISPVPTLQTAVAYGASDPTATAGGPAQTTADEIPFAAPEPERRVSTSRPPLSPFSKGRSASPKSADATSNGAGGRQRRSVTATAVDLEEPTSLHLTPRSSVEMHAAQLSEEQLTTDVAASGQGTHTPHNTVTECGETSHMATVSKKMEPSTVSTYDITVAALTPKKASPQKRSANSAYNDCETDGVFDDELRRLFNEFDTERRGYLDREAFKETYRNMEQYGLEPTTEEINRRFRQYGGRSKQIFFDEFCILMLQRVRM